MKSTDQKKGSFKIKMTVHGVVYYFVRFVNQGKLEDNYFLKKTDVDWSSLRDNATLIPADNVHFIFRRLSRAFRNVEIIDKDAF